MIGLTIALTTFTLYIINLKIKGTYSIRSPIFQVHMNFLSLGDLHDPSLVGNVPTLKIKHHVGFVKKKKYHVG